MIFGRILVPKAARASSACPTTRGSESCSAATSAGPTIAEWEPNSLSPRAATPRKSASSDLRAATSFSAAIADDGQIIRILPGQDPEADGLQHRFVAAGRGHQRLGRRLVFLVDGRQGKSGRKTHGVKFVAFQRLDNRGYGRSRRGANRGQRHQGLHPDLRLLVAQHFDQFGDGGSRLFADIFQHDAGPVARFLVLQRFPHGGPRLPHRHLRRFAAWAPPTPDRLPPTSSRRAAESWPCGAPISRIATTRRGGPGGPGQTPARSASRWRVRTPCQSRPG